MNSINAVFKSYMKEVERDILKADKALRDKTAQVVVNELKGMLNSPTDDVPKKITGNLVKGVGKKNQRYSSIVGFKAPAHHAALVEFGGDVVRGGRKVGERRPHPFLKPAFMHTKAEVIKILSESRT